MELARHKSYTDRETEARVESDQKICPVPFHHDHIEIQASMLVPKLAVLCDTGSQHLQQDDGGLAASAGGVGKRGSRDGTFIKR